MYIDLYLILLSSYGNKRAYGVCKPFYFLFIFIKNFNFNKKIFKLDNIDNIILFNGVKSISRQKISSILCLVSSVPLTILIFSAIKTYELFLGVTVHFWVLIFISIFLLLSEREKIKNSLTSFIKHIASFKKKKRSLYGLSKIEILLFVLIGMQLTNATYRYALPMTHDDAVTQYFFDSLNFSRMTSILDFYKSGFSFRSDSSLAIFEGWYLSYSNYWILPGVYRFLSLVSGLISLKFVTQLFGGGRLSSLIILAVALCLPDVWDAGFSRKHDGYLWCFEIITFSLIISSLLFEKNKAYRSSFAIISMALIISIFLTASRLSSIYLLIITVFSLLLVLIKGFKSKDLDIKLLGFALVPIILTGATFSLTFIINYLYNDNPFYIISPPSSLKTFFANAAYASDYELFKYNYNLHSLPPLLDKAVLYFYSAFGCEILRYITTSKLEGVFPLSHVLANIFESFAPRHLYVSLTSFSPFMALPPFIAILDRKTLKPFSFLIIIGLAWFFLWSSSITYTRVFIAGSLILSVPGVVLYADQIEEIENLKRSLYSKRLIWALGVISIGYCLLFCLLSLINLKNLVNLKIPRFGEENRIHLLESYMKKRNPERWYPTRVETDKINSILINTKSTPVIISPKQTQLAYYVKQGLVLSSFNIPKRKTLRERICSYSQKEKYFQYYRVDLEKRKIVPYCKSAELNGL